MTGIVFSGYCKTLRGERRFIGMRFHLATLLIVITVGPPIFAYSFGGWALPPELDWVLYSLLPPLAAAAILGIWARLLFWSMTHVDEIDAIRREIVGQWQRIAAEVSKRFALIGGIIRWIVGRVLHRIRGTVVPTFHFQIRDLLWLTLVAAVLTQSWIERKRLQERVVFLERSDAVVRTMKESLGLDDAGLDAYVARMTRLPKLSTSLRATPITVIVNGPEPRLHPANNRVPMSTTGGNGPGL